MNTKIWVMDSNWNVVHESLLSVTHMMMELQEISNMFGSYMKPKGLNILKVYTIVVGGMYPPHSEQGKLHLQFDI